MYKPWQGLLFAALLSAGAIADSKPELLLEGAWVRALPPTQANTAAYLDLANSGGRNLIIVGGSAELAGRLEIHTTREIDGYTRMEQLDQLRLAPGESLQLAPGGTHLMLLELERMPATGETIRLCLELAAGEEVCTEAEVRKSAAETSDHQHHHKQD